MVIRQRDLVRHIEFIIELPEHSCSSCEIYVPEEFLEESPKQTIIGDGIFKLFSVLASWKLATGGITFELNAYSPSDSEHWFKNHYFVSDEEGPRHATSTHNGGGGEISSERHDPKTRLDQRTTDQDTPNTSHRAALPTDRHRQSCAISSGRRSYTLRHTSTASLSLSPVTTTVYNVQLSSTREYGI